MTDKVLAAIEREVSAWEQAGAFSGRADGLRFAAARIREVIATNSVRTVPRSGRGER